MKIYETSVKRPITTLMIFLAIIVFGVYSFSRLAIDFFPEIELPAISIITPYIGADAASIEKNITKPLEDRLSGVNDLDEIYSTSRDNLSIITLKFIYGTDLNEAANDARNIIDMTMRFLPEDVDRPQILKFSTSQMPVIVYGVQADQNYEGLDKIIENNITNNLNRINGVASVLVRGAPERVVYVEFDPKKLEAYNITLDQVAAVVSRENIDVPVGDIETKDMEYNVTTAGEFISSDEIKNLIVGFQNGKFVKISDIAVVRDSLRDQKTIDRVNESRGVNISIMKQSDANTVQVSRKVKNELEKITKTLPADVKIFPIYDSSENIQNSINNLSETLLFAFIFVSLVIFLFLGKWSSSLIVLVTIPASLISGFIYLFLAKDTLNIISLSAITIAIGMVVDDAIVVLENITKHIERGSTPYEASIYGTNEVWTAVVASTLVILVVFMPLTLLTGITGAIFRSLGWIVSITIAMSIICAITLTPMLSSRLLKSSSLQYQDNNGKKKKKNLWQSTMGVVLDKLDNAYHKSLTYVLKHKTATLLIALAIFVGTMFLVPMLGFEFLPEADQDILRGTIYLQTGGNIDKTAEFVSKLEKTVNERYPEKYILSISAGVPSDQTASLTGTKASNEIQVTLRLKKREERERTVFEIAEDFRQFLDASPEVIKYDISAGGMGGMTNTVDVKIFGYNIDSSLKVASELQYQISKIPGARDVIIDRANDRPTFNIYVDREKAAKLGLNTAMIGSVVRNYITGYTASKYKEEGYEYDVIFRLSDVARKDVEKFKNLMITTPLGTKVCLSEVANIVEETTPLEISHENKQRVITLNAKPEGISLGELGSSINKIIDNASFPEGITAEVGGSYENLTDSFRDLITLLFVAILLVYIVLAAQFESTSMPLIILFALPFAFSGVVLALLITGNTLSVNAMLGAIMLVGIAVKNSIILVDYTNLLRDRGMRLNDAVVLGGRSRLRPILMTATTTFLGMLPMALSTGEGSELWAPIGIAVIGGLVFSTILSLFVVPVAYHTFIRSGSRRKEIMRARRQFKFIDEIVINNKDDNNNK